MISGILCGTELIELSAAVVWAQFARDRAIPAMHDVDYIRVQLKKQFRFNCFNLKLLLVRSRGVVNEHRLKRWMPSFNHNQCVI